MLRTFAAADTRRNIAFLLGAAAILAAGALLRVHHLFTVGSRTPDERRYAVFGARLADGGLTATADLVREFNRTPALWTLPPPTRVGYTGPLAAVMRVSGLRDPWAGACLSCLCSLLSALVLLLAGARLFDRGTTLCALALLAGSPLSLTLARRAWQDETAGLVAALALFLCGEAEARGGRSRTWQVLALAAAAAAALVKESGFVLFGLCGLWLLAETVRRGRLRSDGPWLAGVGFGAAALAVAAMAGLSGGVRAGLDVYRNVSRSFAANAYVVAFQTGSWGEYLLALYALVPVSATLFCVGVCAAFCAAPAGPPESGPRVAPARRGLALVVLALLAACAAAPYLKNLRFASPVVVPFYLFAGWGARSLFCAARGVPTRALGVAARAVVAGAVLFGPLTEYGNFLRLRAATDAGDLALGKLREAFTVALRPGAETGRDLRD